MLTDENYILFEEAGKDGCEFIRFFFGLLSWAMLYSFEWFLWCGD